MDIVTLFPDKPYIVDDQLEMTVLFIIEEWSDLERRAEVHVTIKIKTPQCEDEITITTENPHLIWHDYEIEYLGGWLKAIQLRIKRTGK
jgi:hypothetical protein